MFPLHRFPTQTLRSTLLTLLILLTPLAPAVLVASALLLGAGPAVASNITGFLPQEGSGTVAFSYNDESYDEFWRGTTRVYNPGLDEISNQSLSLWLSWGFTDRLALVADLAYVETEASGPAAFEDSGLQDATVLLAARLWQSRRGRAHHSLVGAFGLRTPTRSYEENRPVARGDETTDGLLRLAYLLHAGDFYWSQQVGFDSRGDDAPDGIPVYTELGWTPGRVTWIASYNRYFADGGTDIGDPGFTFPSLQEEYERVGAKAVIELDSSWSVFVGGFTTLGGRNSGDADGFSAGLIFDY